jgi:hypothetical protein
MSTHPWPHLHKPDSLCTPGHVHTDLFWRGSRAPRRPRLTALPPLTTLYRGGRDAEREPEQLWREGRDGGGALVGAWSWVGVVWAGAALPLHRAGAGRCGRPWNLAGALAASSSEGADPGLRVRHNQGVSPDLSSCVGSRRGRCCGQVTWDRRQERTPDFL